MRDVAHPRAHAGADGSDGIEDEERREEDRHAGAGREADPAAMLDRLLVLVDLDLTGLALGEDGGVVGADVAVFVQRLDAVVVALRECDGLVHAGEEEHRLVHRVGLSSNGWTPRPYVRARGRSSPEPD